jgi:hypothetical protein
MIATESGCCLRPLGIVLDEQRYPMIFSYPHRRALSPLSGYHIVICSSITNPFGRVHAISVVIIHVAGWL